MKVEPARCVQSVLALVAALAVVSCGGGGSEELGVGPSLPPDLAVTKAAAPGTVPETGGNVNFVVSVTNSTADSWILDSLTDSDFDLTTLCPLIAGSPTPVVLAAGETRTCNFTRSLAGSSAGPPHQNTVTAQFSNGGQVVTETASATVTFSEVQIATFTSDLPAGTMRMTPFGAADDADFSIDVVVSSIANFYAAAFHVTYDPAVVDFVGADTSRSFLLGAGPPTLFFADLVGGTEGEIAVEAGLQGNVAGVASGSGVLITLNFSAIAAATDSRIDFDPPAFQRITVCPTPGPGCSDTTRTWTGGSLDVD